jgi:hypothetical protein
VQGHIRQELRKHQRGVVDPVIPSETYQRLREKTAPGPDILSLTLELQDLPALVAGAYATIHFSHPQGSRS